MVGKTYILYTRIVSVQVLHNMSMWTAKEKSLTYDQAKEEAARAQKDIKMVNNSLILSSTFTFSEVVFLK